MKEGATLKNPDYAELGAKLNRGTPTGYRPVVSEVILRAEIVGSDQRHLWAQIDSNGDLVIAGQDWKAGDEALMAIQDYGSMLDMFEQVSKRYGVVLNKVSIPNLPASDEEIVSLYADRPCLKYGKDQYTYTQTNQRINQVAHAGHALGLKAGDVVTTGAMCQPFDLSETGHQVIARFLGQTLSFTL